MIGGVEDHIHIATHIHPSVSLASLVKDLKLAGTKHIKEKNLFPDFSGWQSGYGAFTYAMKNKDNLVNYVKNQEEHHLRKSYETEYIELLKKHHVEYDSKYFLK